MHVHTYMCEKITACCHLFEFHFAHTDRHACKQATHFLLHLHIQLAVRSCLFNDSYPLNYTAAVYGREGSVTASESPLVLPSMTFEPPLTANARYLVTITVCNSLIVRETAPLPICRDLKIERCFTYFTFALYL